MEAPSLVLVPPTPFDSQYHRSPLARSAPRPPSFVKPIEPEQERNSSESSTIVTIYSMYGERRQSWTPSASSVIEEAGDPDLPATTNYHRDSIYQSRRTSAASTSYNYETAPQSRRSSKLATISDYGNDATGSSRTSYTESPRQKSTSWEKRTSTASTGAFQSSDHQPHLQSSSTMPELDNYDARSTPIRPARSKPPSIDRTSQVSEWEGLKAPPARHSLPATPRQQPVDHSPPRRSSQLTQPRTPTRIPLPLSPGPEQPRTPSRTPPRPSRELPSPPRPPQTPATPGSYIESHLQPNAIGSSSHSLTPSEGEDADSFHVRNTYAELDNTGVSGDGFEEGVERTRARVSGQRDIELKAAEALAKEQERSRDISAKEEELLASLDRYGFFVVPSHDRLVLLPTATLSKPLTRTTSAVTSGPPSPPHLPSLPNLSPSPKENSRIAKWGRMLEPETRDEGGNIDTWRVNSAKERKLRKRIYKGIPDRWRIATWELLVRRYAGAGKREDARLKTEYREALENPSTYDVQIDLDVPRTINGHILFRTRYGLGQRSLFHVLHSFSLRCSECGYCQGMGPLAATLLSYFEPERVYATLVHLHDAYSMHSIFRPGFPGLLEAIYVQERITERMMPEIFAAFKKHMISTTSYATKWYITLFANSVPFQTQLRLWDAFLLDGRDVFVVMAVAVVWVFRDHLTSSQASFETILSLLSSFFVPEDEDTLMRWIEKVLEDKKLRDDMRKWREEWNTLVSQGKEGDALL